MTTQMTDIYQFKLLPNASGEDFESFATERGFLLAKVTRAGDVERQYLLHDGDNESPGVYFWIVQWTLTFDIEVLPAIPSSLWTAASGIEEYCHQISFNRLVLRKNWQRKIRDSAS